MPKFYARNLLSDQEVTGDGVSAEDPQKLVLVDKENTDAQDRPMDTPSDHHLISHHVKSLIANAEMPETQKLEPETELESPLDTPELPQPHHLTAPIDESSHEAEPEAKLPTPNKPDSETQSDDNTDPIKTLIFWKAASRPFRKKDRSFYTTVAILIILISLIAVLAGEKMLIGVLFALGFLVYVLNFIAPEEVDYKMTTQGVTIGDHFYHWKELDSFWFTQKDGFKLLHILTQLRFPGVLILVLGPEVSEEDIKRVCVRYLPFHEIAPKSLIDKWAESLQKHFPLENPHKSV